MESGDTVYILKQLKRIGINIFVFAQFVCSKGDFVDKKMTSKILPPPPPPSQYLIPAKICGYEEGRKAFC